MFRINRFAQVMKSLPRGVFDALVRRHSADKGSKGFSCFDQLTAMTYAQLSGASSLRELETSFNSQSVHHYHLGTRALARSTLSDANSKRPSALFGDLAKALMPQVAGELRQRCDAMLHLLDSTTITLKGQGFDTWTTHTRTRCGQGLKLHVLWDSQTCTTLREEISATNVNDRDIAVTLPLEAGATYVFDKGYCDYTWWHAIGEAKANFVTRFKRNAGLVVQEQRPIPAADALTILADEVVTLKYRHARGGRAASPALRLRRITVARTGDTPLVLATNNFDLPAADVAQCYKTRWNIELFFKWIKQHLSVKQFLGRTENAVRIQLYCALIVHLLLSLYRRRHAPQRTLYEVLIEVRATLFHRPDTDADLYRRRRERQIEVASRQAVLWV